MRSAASITSGASEAGGYSSSNMRRSACLRSLSYRRSGESEQKGSRARNHAGTCVGGVGGGAEHGTRGRVKKCERASSAGAAGAGAREEAAGARAEAKDESEERSSTG